LKKSVHGILKVGRYEHMKAFLDKGEMYFNTVEYFRKTESNQERFDENEGAESIEQINWVKLQAVDGSIYEFHRNDTKSIKLLSANLLTFEEKPKGNIFSCTAITPDTIRNNKFLDARLRQFGDTMIIIKSPSVFIERVSNVLKNNNLDFLIGLVSYYNPKIKEGKLSVFTKRNSLSYQNEIRIWIKQHTNKPIIINIGSMKELSLFLKIS
jgi:hypothetical protein